MRLTSTNPHFSYIISKNPSSPCLIKNLRKGFLISGFSKDDKQTYISTFIDEEGPCSSFTPNSYVSPSHTPLLYSNMLSSLFSSAMKTRHEKDLYGGEDDDNEFYSCIVEIPFFPLSQKDLLIAKNYYKNFIIGITPWEGTNKCSVVINSSRTIYETLHLVQTLIFISLINEDQYLNYSTDGFLDKYMNSCEIVGLPYPFISRIKNNFLTKTSAFNSFKEKLELCFSKYLDKKLELSYGDLLSARKRWVESIVDESLPLVDLGCGTGNYVYLSKKVSRYIPIDIDEGARHKISLKLEDKHVDNYEGPYASLDDYLVNEITEPTQYLMTEVLEHMKLDQALSLIGHCLKKGNAHSFIITFPNKDFNHFYPSLNSNGFRHPDHEWEGDQSIIDSILQYITNKGFAYSYQLSGIGDAIIDPSSITYRPTYALFIKVL